VICRQASGKGQRKEEAHKSFLYFVSDNFGGTLLYQTYISLRLRILSPLEIENANHTNPPSSA
jgi:hypothetical protein